MNINTNVYLGVDHLLVISNIFEFESAKCYNGVRSGRNNINRKLDPVKVKTYDWDWFIKNNFEEPAKICFTTEKKIFRKF